MFSNLLDSIKPNHISLPCHPGVQVQSPESGSHWAPLRHGHSFPQSSPHLPGGQATKKIKLMIANHTQINVKVNRIPLILSLVLY